MAVPKKKTSKSKKKMRNSKINLKRTNYTKCYECNNLKIMHSICSNCGVYRKTKKNSI